MENLKSIFVLEDLGLNLLFDVIMDMVWCAKVKNQGSKTATLFGLIVRKLSHNCTLHHDLNESPSVGGAILSQDRCLLLFVFTQCHILFATQCFHNKIGIHQHIW